MKMPKKVVVSSLALFSALTLAGSISGTIAWYQYATRAQVAYTGTSAHCSKLLQLSVDNGTSWSSDIKSSELPSVSFAPITTGAQDKDAPLWAKHKTITIFDDDGITPVGTQNVSSYFYAQPDRGQGLYDNWLLAADTSYAQFDILIKVKDIDGKVKDIDGNDVETKLINDVYLTDLTIEDANRTNQLDLANAIRVHISSEYKDNDITEKKNFLFAKESESIEVGGFLDIDEDGELDMIGYEWDRQTCLYGAGTFIPATYDDEGNKLTDDSYTDVPYQYSYKADDSSIIAGELDGELVGGTPIGKTCAGENDFLKVTVTIWLEGWSSLLRGSNGTQDTSIWDAESYLEQKFNVGMTFGVALHNSNE